MRRATIFLLISIAASRSLAAQPKAPDADIWLAPLRRANGVTTVGAPTNLTARAGYDNQPWFLPDGSGLLYVAEDGGQTDVFRYDFATARAEPLTRTAEWREYSPTLQPDGSLRVVRWDLPIENGALWRYSARGEPLAPVLPAVPNVGYYAEVDSETVALFVNDSVQSFVVADTRTGRADTVRTGIGGSAPRRVPGANAVTVLTRDSASREWWITRYDVDTRRFTPLVRALRGGTQYAWTRRGTILMAHESTLYEWDPRGGPGWLEIARLPQVGRISRITLSPREDQTALVGER